MGQFESHTGIKGRKATEISEISKNKNVNLEFWGQMGGGRIPPWIRTCWATPGTMPLAFNNYPVQKKDEYSRSVCIKSSI